MNTFSNSRRIALKVCTAVAGVLTMPGLVLADWPSEAFKTDTLGAAIKALYGVDADSSDKIALKAPDIAENGAVVPITVTSDLDKVESISIYVDGNPNPLAASFDIGEHGVADVSTRIKMSKTSNVVAVVKADGKAYQTSQEVKVTIGGCGG